MHPRSVAAAARCYPKSEVRGGGREELPRLRGQRRPGGVTPSPRPGPAAGRSNPRSGGCTAQEGLVELSHVEGRNGGSKEIPLVQGKEQRLCFAGAAVKRYPTPR